MHELAHRVKNTLAVVQSIATQSLRNATSIQEAGEKLQSRIAALGKAHDVLMQSNWVSASIRDVIEVAASNVCIEDGDRLRLSGPSLSLAPQAALSFDLVTHELLTNAVKYGALSTSDGHVRVTWQTEPKEGAVVVHFVWQEIGGPKVQTPERSGFGSKLIRASLGALGEFKLAPRRYRGSKIKRSTFDGHFSTSKRWQES